MFFMVFFFFAKQGERQTSGDNTDIPTGLASREASVLCLSNSKIQLKKKGGKSMYKERGGLGQSPQKRKANKEK